MTYWRMQLHPSRPNQAVEYTVKSLAAGYIGLDFSSDVGNLLRVSQTELPQGQRDYWGFAHEMKEDDRVLIIAHHFPFALVKVTGGYNYIHNIVPEIGVWFRHFRAVNDIRFYGDFFTNAKDWQQTTMTDTISPLRDKKTLSFQLIEQWLS